MRMQQKTILISIFLSIALRGIPQVEISFTQPITDNFIESKLIQEISFFPLQYEKINSISYDMELRFENHNYFILDNKQTQCVYRYDEEGNLLNLICEQKLEASDNNLPILSNPVKFNINPYLEQVELFNFQNSTLQRYSYSGKKLDEIVFSINPADFTRDSNGNYWIYTGWNHKETQFRLIKTDPTGKIIDRKMRFPSKCTPIENFSFSISNYGIHLCELLGNSTFLISENSISETFYLNYGIKNLSQLFHSMEAKDSYQFLNHNGYYSIRKYLENDHFAYFSVNFKSTEGRNIFHIIYDKKTQRTFKYVEDAAIDAFGKAQALTDDDELVFLVSPRRIRQLSGNGTYLLPSVFDNLIEAVNTIRNTMIVKIKLQSPEN
jgi:hypothetical protein